MSIKSDIKMSLLHEQGVRADDQLEAAYKRQAAHDGAKQALRLIAKNISGLAALVDKDLEEGRLSTDEPAKIASYVKLMIDRAANSAISASHHQENLQISTGGEIAAYLGMVEAIKKDILAEQSKVDAIQRAISSGVVTVEDGSPVQPDGEDRGRPTGVHPGMNIAAQRRAEEAAEEAASNVGAADKPQKRRGRKKAT